MTNLTFMEAIITFYSSHYLAWYKNKGEAQGKDEQRQKFRGDRREKS